MYILRLYICSPELHANASLTGEDARTLYKTGRFARYPAGT